MNSRNKTYPLIFGALGIAINIVLGTVAGSLNLPLLFLDTIGTIFVAVVFGPTYGAITGGLTNVIQGAITGPKIIPFAIVNIVVGLLVGYIAKKREFGIGTAIFTGILLSIVAPLIGTPIATYLYDGITGDFNDILFTVLRNTGQKMFPSVFFPRVVSNLVDKIASCVLVSMLVKTLPKKYTKGMN